MVMFKQINPDFKREKTLGFPTSTKKSIAICMPLLKFEDQYLKHFYHY